MRQKFQKIKIETEKKLKRKKQQHKIMFTFIYNSYLIKFKFCFQVFFKLLLINLQIKEKRK
jgi:hypothetical protein